MNVTYCFNNAVKSVQVVLSKLTLRVSHVERPLEVTQCHIRMTLLCAGMWCRRVGSIACWLPRAYIAVLCARCPRRYKHRFSIYHVPWPHIGSLGVVIKIRVSY